MTTIIVDIPEAILAETLADADVVAARSDLDSGAATDAVVIDALALWATLENPREVLQGRTDTVCRSAPTDTDADTDVEVTPSE